MITKDQLAQKHAPIVHFHPEEGSFCCFPSDAEPAYEMVKAGWQAYPKTPKVLERFPCYHRVSLDTPKGITRIQYWLWYNYDNFPAPLNIPRIGDHFGDWEHFEVVLQNDVPFCYFLSNHTGALRFHPEGLNLSTDGRAHIWVAKGSHAHYESPAPHHKWPFDEIADGGQVADTQIFLIDILGTTFFKDNFTGDWAFGAGTFSPPKRPVDENKL